MSIPPDSNPKVEWLDYRYLVLVVKNYDMHSKTGLEALSVTILHANRPFPFKGPVSNICIQNFSLTALRFGVKR